MYKTIGKYRHLPKFRKHTKFHNRAWQVRKPRRHTSYTRTTALKYLTISLTLSQVHKHLAIAGLLPNCYLLSSGASDYYFHLDTRNLTFRNLKACASHSCLYISEFNRSSVCFFLRHDVFHNCHGIWDITRIIYTWNMQALGRIKLSHEIAWLMDYSRIPNEPHSQEVALWLLFSI